MWFASLHHTSPVAHSEHVRSLAHSFYNFKSNNHCLSAVLLHGSWTLSFQAALPHLSAFSPVTISLAILLLEETSCFFNIHLIVFMLTSSWLFTSGVSVFISKAKNFFTYKMCNLHSKTVFLYMCHQVLEYTFLAIEKIKPLKPRPE